ncbi:MAG: ATP-binding protein [Acidobacteria bacterium]|nr:ATP-binding protein [Acidobacteriota bacterium]
MSVASSSPTARVVDPGTEPYGSMFLSTSDYVFAKDLAGVYVEANPAFLAALGREVSDVIGHRDEEFFPPDIALENTAREQLVQLCGHELEDEVTLTLNGHPRQLVLRRLPWRNAEGDVVGVAGVGIDVTGAHELQQSLQALQKAQVHVSQASRLQALGQVASGVAHDFNNALTTILGLSDWLLYEMTPDAPHRGDIETIRTAALDAAAMVRRLQMFGRLAPSSNRAEPHEFIDLGEIASAVADLVRPRCQELADKTGHRFDVVVDARHGPIVLGTPAEIRELLINLVFNSLDAMPHGGSVRIVARDLKGHPEVSVIDTGIGMTDEVKARVFEPFFSTKGNKGNGLGLSVCASLAERHRAKFFVESEPGVGTTFKLTFPPPTPIESPRPAAPSHDPAASVGTFNVLVVDDEPDVCESLAAMVAAMGHKVTTARDGLEAVAIVANQPIEVIVTDLGMPGINGIELASRVATVKPHVAIVLMTAWAVDFGPEPPPGIGSIVAKPATMGALQQAVADAVRRHQQDKRSEADKASATKRAKIS